MKNYYLLLIPIGFGVIVGGVLAHFFDEDSESEKLLTVQKLVTEGSPIEGNPSAPITILEWGDYQCTFCYRFHQSSLKIIQNEYIQSGKVRLVFKDFPLNGPDSVLAAEASYCAEDQEKYWIFHNELYNNWAGERTGWITRNSLNSFAQNVGLNLDEFNECIDVHKYRTRVLTLENFGKEIGIDATPSFLIFNNEKIVKIRGNQPIEVFKQIIDEM